MFEKLKNILKKFNNIKSKNKVYQLNTFSYEKLIELMKERGTLEEFENELNNFDEINELMENKTNLHGINHIVRVLFNAYAIVTLENINDRDKKIIIESAKLHDIGRISDGEDEEHGAKSAIKARDILKEKGMSSEQIDEICFLIKEHSIPKDKNNEHIQELPEKLRENYRYCLNCLKDADKLDRVRIGDLDFKRLSTDSAKRLIETSKYIYENNIYYYKNKMKVYPFDENEANKILEEIEKENLEIDIDIEEIKKNYSSYKAMQEQGKLKWLNAIDEDTKLKDVIEIANIVTKEEIEYFHNVFHAGSKLIIQAINSMGINKFLELKENGRLNELFKLENYIELINKMSQEEIDLIRNFRKNDMTNEVVDTFYIYYYAIKNFDKEKINLLLINNKDKVTYINGETNKKDSGYKWIEDIIHLRVFHELLVIKKINSKFALEIREKYNIPMNIIITGILDLNLFNETMENVDVEKILKNYYKFNLNINKEKDGNQIKRLLLDLPEDLENSYEQIIKECTIGKLKRFKLDTFKQIKDYEKICDKKILQEFENEDDIEKLRKLIFETKIENLYAVKRDIHFYKEYIRNEETKDEVATLFEKLFSTKNKGELLEAYKTLNHISETFELDDSLKDIRSKLSEISKEDVILQMDEMKKQIESAETKIIDGQEVIDLTSTDFNLLISVIGGSGSPYLVEYCNNLLSKVNRFQDRKLLFPILRKYTDRKIKIGIKKLVNKRYKMDPLKNKQRCVSSINQDFIGHIRSENYTEKGEKKQTEEKLILAYFPKNKENVSYMGNQDLMTIYDKDRNDPTRKRIPHKDNIQGICYLKLKDLNSIILGENNEIIVDSNPGAIMCFDKVSDISKKTAKKLGIPILYIDTKEQFKFMEAKLEEYYITIQNEILENNTLTNETFEKVFNIFEQDNNIIHRAFKMASGFTFLDDDEYPKEKIIEIFDKMTILVTESLKRCNKNQREIVKIIMQKEANHNNLRYGHYDKFISFKKLRDLVNKEGTLEELDK